MTFLLLGPLKKSAVHTGRPGLHPLPPGPTTTLGDSTGHWLGPLAASTIEGLGMKGLVVGRKGLSLPVGLVGDGGKPSHCGRLTLGHVWTWFEEEWSAGWLWGNGNGLLNGDWAAWGDCGGKWEGGDCGGDGRLKTEGEGGDWQECRKAVFGERENISHASVGLWQPSLPPCHGSGVGGLAAWVAAAGWWRLVEGQEALSVRDAARPSSPKPWWLPRLAIGWGGFPRLKASLGRDRKRKFI